MAAELMQIKVKMLLPPEKGEEEELDPRTIPYSASVRVQTFQRNVFEDEELRRRTDEGALSRLSFC